MLRHRDSEYQQLKIRYETLKGERESEIVQMENIILELQLELYVGEHFQIDRLIVHLMHRRAARDEAEFKRKKPQPATSTTPPKNQSSNQKQSSPTTPTNERPETIDM